MDDAPRSPAPWPVPSELAALVERIGIGLVELAPDSGRLLTVNPAFCEITGYPADALLGMTVADLTHPDDAARDARARGRLARGESHYEVDERYVRKDGRVVWVHVVGDVARDPAGRVVRAYAAVSDISPRVRAEAELRESESRYRRLFEHSATGVVTTDADDLILDCNPAFAALVGRPPAALTGVPVSVVVHPDDREAHRGQTRRCWADDGAVCDWEHRLAADDDGTPVWVRSVCQRERDTSGRMVRLARYVVDITARKRIEGALRESQEQQHDLVETLQLLLETAAQGILSVDESGRIMSANRAVEAMFGYGHGGLVGRDVDLLVPEAVRVAHGGHRAAYWRTPGPRPMARGRDLVGRRADGSTFPVEVSLNFVLTSGGGRAVAFITDITDRKAAESTLAHAHAALQERARALEHQTLQLRRMASALTVAEQRAREALARTLHDHLQQLLFSTKLRLDRLERSVAAADAVPPDAFGRLRAELDEAIAAARSLAVDLYPPVLQRHGLPGALAWLATWMREKHGLLVTLTADPAADVDDRDTRTFLFESVRELLFDVVKHAGVTTAAVDLARDPDDWLRITVSDVGVGFDPAALLEADGDREGLGLARIREHVITLGGRFDVESPPGHGARFRLRVPRRRPGEAAAPPAAAAGPLPLPLEPSPDRPPVRVLLVDDHTAVREGLREILRETPGVEVVGEAADGREAIARAQALRPDVIVMDVSMPGVDGVEATRRILADHPWIRIYGFSTHERTERLHDIEAAGAAGFFLKQTGADELVRHILARPPAR